MCTYFTVSNKLTLTACLGFLLYIGLTVSPLESYSQTGLCPDDPPSNPFLADSPWPIYHRNNYAQSSTCLRGPEPGDKIGVKVRRDIQGGTSPWVYLTEPYTNSNSRAILYSNSTHIFKFYDNGEAIVAADSMRIDFDPLTSFGWNFLLARNKIWYTYDPKYNPSNNQTTRLFKLTDADTADIRSDIVMLDTFDFGEYGINRVQHFSINYLGQIVFNSDNDTLNNRGTVGVISQEFELLDTLHFDTRPGEITNHNAFPIDESNNFYITTNSRILAFSWDGKELRIAWQADYDFVNDGPVGTFAEGSGTTPTLLGWGDDQDKLVVMSDGHARNNLLAFWREIPDDWETIDGMPPRFAGAIELPAARSFSNAFQSIENSPCAFGYSIGIAQYNGFLGYDCENVKGVQRVDWNRETNKFEIAWVNRDINMNGVLTYSSANNILYGSGKEGDCNYYYYGLDWNSGQMLWRFELGPEGTFLDDPFYDAGNNNVIDENGDIYFAGGASLVKLELLERAVSSVKSEASGEALLVLPSPADGFVTLQLPDTVNLLVAQQAWNLTILDLRGRKVLETQKLQSSTLDVSQLPPGLYLLRLELEERVLQNSFVKR